MAASNQDSLWTDPNCTRVTDAVINWPLHWDRLMTAQTVNKEYEVTDIMRETKKELIHSMLAEVVQPLLSNIGTAVAQCALGVAMTFFVLANFALQQQQGSVEGAALQYSGVLRDINSRIHPYFLQRSIWSSVGNSSDISRLYADVLTMQHEELVLLHRNKSMEDSRRKGCWSVGEEVIHGHSEESIHGSSGSSRTCNNTSQEDGLTMNEGNVMTKMDRGPSELYKDDLVNNHRNVYTSHVEAAAVKFGYALSDGVSNSLRIYVYGSEDFVTAQKSQHHHHALPSLSVTPPPSLSVTPPPSLSVTPPPSLSVTTASSSDFAALTQGADFCSGGQWAADVGFHEFLLSSSIRTLDPSNADFFFVPAYAICLYEANILTISDLSDSYKSVISSLPYFSPTRGRDHIFTFSSGASAGLFPEWRTWIDLSIKLSPETELFNDFPHLTDPHFDTWKDISVPGTMDIAEAIRFIDKAKAMESRQVLGSFYGSVDGSRGRHPSDPSDGKSVREALLDLGNMKGIEVFSVPVDKDRMIEGMGNSVFCFVPRGKSGWSLRLFESLFAGCVPVLLSDNWELPFEDIFDVTKFVIKWPCQKIDKSLWEYLGQLVALYSHVVRDMITEAQRVRCWFMYPPSHLSSARWDGLLDRFKKTVCEEFDVANSYVATSFLLHRKTRASKTAIGSSYYYPRIAEEGGW
eukprot:GHVQ01013182.1.p1 GENE.GHVQ01013182.1~~GHVQ01013182.1.p1  ORF type:complete len:690 (-),score=142.70 GHVQ01013182.1:787-2856(-)